MNKDILENVGKYVSIELYGGKKVFGYLHYGLDGLKVEQGGHFAMINPLDVKKVTGVKIN
jgi:hypothetical protein